MLRGFHPNPAEAAEALLTRFNPPVSIETARRRRAGKEPVSRERWAMGLTIARWLIRLGLAEPPQPPKDARTDSPLRERLLMSMRGLETERMVAIFADERGRVIAQDLVAEGERGQLRLSLRRIFAKALSRDARRMILAHNHPSGCAEPSDCDVLNTRRLREYAHSLGIALEDHLIVGHDSITSMRSRGLV